MAKELGGYRMSDDCRRLILFARYPVPGGIKTRLIPALGAEGATALHQVYLWSMVVEVVKSSIHSL